MQRDRFHFRMKGRVDMTVKFLLQTVCAVGQVPVTVRSRTESLGIPKLVDTSTKTLTLGMVRLVGADKCVRLVYKGQICSGKCRRISNGLIEEREAEGGGVVAASWSFPKRVLRNYCYSHKAATIL